MSFDSRAETWTHIHKVQKNLRQMAIELTRRGLEHDQSKLHSPEVEVLNETTVRLRKVEYGSDEYRRALAEMDAFTEHHYAHNDHHPEFHQRGIHDINLIQLMEMLADWKAASERHPNGSLEKSIRDNASRFGYDDKLKDILMATAVSLGWV